MPATEIFSSVRVPSAVRQGLKRLSAVRDIPMYLLIQTWVEAEEAKERQGQSHEPRRPRPTDR